MALKKSSDHEPRQRIQVRSGRPPRERAGEVDQRILDAARSVFLERGFEGASIDEVAEAARAGKPTIYARHPSKEALFTAVVLRDIDERFRFDNVKALGATLEERLTFVGAEILARGLRNETVGLFRLVIAESRRFPALASGVGHAARSLVVAYVSKLLQESADGEFGPRRPVAEPDRLATLAWLFTDLVFMPMIMRALLADSMADLRDEIPVHVANRVTIFLTAFRSAHGDRPV